MEYWFIFVFARLYCLDAAAVRKLPSACPLCPDFQSLPGGCTDRAAARVTIVYFGVDGLISPIFQLLCLLRPVFRIISTLRFRLRYVGRKEIKVDFLLQLGFRLLWQYEFPGGRLAKFRVYLPLVDHDVAYEVAQERKCHMPMRGASVPGICGKSPHYL